MSLHYIEHSSMLPRQQDQGPVKSSEPEVTMNETTVVTTLAKTLQADNSTSINNGSGQLFVDHNPRFWNGVIVLILLLLNVIGNGLVVAVNYMAIKKNVFSFYVVVLAVLDLATAFTTMLFDVITKMALLDDKNQAVVLTCKFCHFQVYTNHMLCGCVLILIAQQRYTKVFYPHKRGLAMKQATLVLMGLGGVCALLSLSTFVTHSTQKIQLQHDGREVNVTICRYAKKYEHSLLQALLSTILSLVFLLVLITNVFYYGYITKALRDMESPFSERFPNALEGTSPSPVLVFASPSDHDRRESNTGVSKRAYQTFGVVTLVFVLSYLPHLAVLGMLYFVYRDYGHLTGTQRFFLDLAYNAPYISTISNPWIYGFSRQEFRQQCYELITLSKYRARRSYF